jgi:RNA polymerase sigma-70 factor (ECF subfamily)
MPADVTRASLLSRVRDTSNDAAWREFQALYRDLLIRFCRRRSIQEADADDIVQNVMTSLARSLPGFVYDPKRGRFRDYLFRCVRSALSDWGACQKRAGAAVPLLDTDGPGGPSDAARALEQEWVDHHFRLAIEELSRTAEPVALEILRATLAGRSVRDIARAIGAQEAAVYKSQQRLRDRLRARVADQIAAEEGRHARGA